jgi:hypothetical protein
MGTLLDIVKIAKEYVLATSKELIYSNKEYQLSIQLKNQNKF